MILIGLAGKFGAGKDSVADTLVKHLGFKKISFAEPLRKECTRAILEQSYPECIPADLRRELCTAKPIDVWSKPTPAPIRRLLQLWGTEYRREQDVDYWVKRTEAEIIKAWEEGKDLVIADTRFENEARLVKLYGELWLVERPGLIADCALRLHPSEELAQSYKDWDYVVANIGTLDGLENDVLEAFIRRFWKAGVSKGEKACR